MASPSHPRAYFKCSLGRRPRKKASYLDRFAVLDLVRPLPSPSDGCDDFCRFCRMFNRYDDGFYTLEESIEDIRIRRVTLLWRVVAVTLYFLISALFILTVIATLDETSEGLLWDSGEPVGMRHITPS